MVQSHISVPEKVQIDEKKYSTTFGRFIVQPLEKGYGVTLGNALRRVLLSSIPGVAFTTVRIDGVLHEFSTVPGVVEDVAEMILNLKAVRMKVNDKKITKVGISLTGPLEFTAGEIQKANPNIEILNPNLHIATLDKGANLEMELTIGRGKGYVTAEENKSSNYPAGTIAMDSIFSPIKNVRYFIEQTRVGQKTDYEKLIIEIDTDGSITPDDALCQAASILNDHIQLFVKLNLQFESAESIKDKDSEFQRIRKILQTSIDELELSVRSYNCLRTANIKTIADLVRQQELSLLKIRNFGRKSLSELTEILEQFGLSFGMDVDKYLINGE